MNIKIHRGTKEIGGTCVELTAENGKKLMIDAGAPLDNSNPDTSYIENQVDGILISHPHQDHYGLLEDYKGNAKIYIGEVALDFINAAKLFLGKDLLQGDFQLIKPKKSLKVAGTFKVTPYLTDHSTPESFAFLIEADGKKIYYSGDFRATGRKGMLFERTISKPPKEVDVLLIEGTMIEREQHKYPTEQSVENAIFDIVKSQKNISSLVSSAQNIDRLVSLIRVCIKLNKKVVIDPYTAWLLDKLHKQSPKIPTVDWDQIVVYNKEHQMTKIVESEYDGFRKRVEDNSVGNEVFYKPSNYIYFERNPNQTFHQQLLKHGHINIIYSQWEGYLTSEYHQYFTDNINELKEHPNYNFYSIHTSGHAVVEDLILFTKAIKAKEVYPIHTAYPDKFKKVFEENGITNVKSIKDNIIYKIN